MTESTETQLPVSNINEETMRLIAQIHRTILEVDNLPTLPKVALEVMKIAQDSNSSITDLVEIIEEDMALSGRVIRAANSAYYGVPRKIDSIKMAIVVLGMDEIHNLVTSITVMQSFSERSATEGFDLTDFWKHCAMTAGLTVDLYDGLRVKRAAGAYIGGLLHDTGKLIIDQYFNEHFIEIIKLVQGSKMSFIEAELQLIGIDHGHIGSWLLGRWNFPTNIIQAVAQHHVRPVDTPKDSLPVFIDWASRLSHFFDEMTIDELIEKLGNDSEWNDFIEGYPQNTSTVVTVLGDKLEKSLKLHDIL